MESLKYPWSNYTLKWKGGPITTTKYVIFVTQIAVVIILSYLSVVLLGPLSYSGISIFYFVTPFFIIFTMWWGLWGMIGAYLGAVIGAGLMVGLGVVPSVLYSISDFVTALIPFIVYRGLLAKRGIDPLFRDLVFKQIHGYPAKRKEAWAWFILIPTFISNVVGAEIGVGIQYLLGLIPPAAFWFWWWGWVISGVIPMIIFTPILVAGLTDLVERQGLINYGWIS
ncbi:MAG: hypothetical protein ACP5GS_05925 [Nitrososphaeria archaeon]